MRWRQKVLLLLDNVVVDRFSMLVKVINIVVDGSLKCWFLLNHFTPTIVYDHVYWWFLSFIKVNNYTRNAIIKNVIEEIYPSTIIDSKIVLILVLVDENVIRGSTVMSGVVGFVLGLGLFFIFELLLCSCRGWVFLKEVSHLFSQLISNYPMK